MPCAEAPSLVDLQNEITGRTRVCVVVPVFNHALTIGRVVRQAKSHFPVIAVDDGSTDGTGGILAAEGGITVITLPRNCGKGAALRAGFTEAERLGFTHAITIDADGQHAPGELPGFAAASLRQPAALVIGARDLAKERAPWVRRVSNRLSAFWFGVETGVKLEDSQCGFRCHPLRAIRCLRVGSQRYAFELELMVRAAWAGIPIVTHPVSADYAAPTSRLSHFRPLLDTARISLLHARLALEALCVPARLRRLASTGELREQPPAQYLKAAMRRLLSAMGAD
jgi:glycosyltransferase involved in cell wall biosynthesis